MNIGKTIKSLRKERSLTAQNLADSIGLTREHVSAMETNKKNPSFPTLEKICDAFNITMKEFFDDGTDNTLSPQLRKLLINIKKIDPPLQQNIINMIENISNNYKVINKPISEIDTTYIVDLSIKPNGLTKEEELEAAQLIRRLKELKIKENKEP